MKTEDLKTEDEKSTDSFFNRFPNVRGNLIPGVAKGDGTVLTGHRSGRDKGQIYDVKLTAVTSCLKITWYVVTNSRFSTTEMSQSFESNTSVIYLAFSLSPSILLAIS